MTTGYNVKRKHREKRSRHGTEGTVKQMKREVIYRTDAMAAVGNLKGLSDTDRSKAMQAVLDLPAVPTCDDAVSKGVGYRNGKRSTGTT